MHGAFRDPSGSMIAFYDMMKKQIVMPAHLMDDGEHLAKTGRNLFKDFSSVAQSTGTYTGHVSSFSDPCHHLHKYSFELAPFRPLGVVRLAQSNSHWPNESLF